MFCGHSEPVPTSAPWRMDGKWSGNSFLLGSSSLANHGGYLSYIWDLVLTELVTKVKPKY